MLSNSELLLRLMLAALLGSLIGFERERLSGAAGLRTHMLVCVGSCLIMIVSAFGFADILGTKNVMLDPSRMAAQVVSGIGFLGAGAILLRGDTVRGLTTAASVWSVAAIGLASGSGLYLAAIFSTLIIYFILAGIKPWEERYREKTQSYTVSFLAVRGQMNIDIMRKALGEKTSHVKQFIMQQNGTSDHDEVIISLSRIPHFELLHIIEVLKQLPFVSEVKEDRIAR